jgi:hypothetical protein
VFKVVFVVKKLKMLCVLGRACVVLVVMVLPAANSIASSVIYQFEPVFTGPPPGGQAPQIVATFQDISPGKVLLTISAANLIRGGFLSDLYFNFDPADNVNQMHFTRLYSPGGPIFSKISTGDNAFRVGDYGYYDIHLAFSKTSLGRSSGGNYVAFQIAEPGLNALDFAFAASFGNMGSYYALARIQELCGNSQWLGCSSVPPQPVPEPAATSFLALAVGAGWACLRGKQTKLLRCRI